ncbi:MAG: N-acetyl-gamma-glutamyl-phosphate reductase [Bacteroidota bacterium]
MNQKINVGIIGGAGYTAGELLRILLNHPKVEILFVHSSSQQGKAISTIHSDLIGESSLNFTSEFSLDRVDVLFFCQGHGKAKEFMDSHTIPSHLSIIDLSRDYRLKEEGNSFVYGLPELNREAIQKSTRVANPGCFATCIQLGLLPLASEGALPEEVHIHAITGSTGAGQNPSPTTHFSWRNNNLSIYKAFTHQHLGEIRQSLEQLQNDFSGELNFIPLRGNFSRGIYASIYLNYPNTEQTALKLYNAYYAPHPFVWVQPEIPHLKQVANTNKCVLSISHHGDKLLIVSAIDNLLKGASGQAVQNLNLMYDWEETLGLRLKGNAF